MRACLTAACILVVAATSATARADDSLARLRAQIAQILVEEGVPGAGIALVEGERIVWAGGVGLADRERRVPVTADTLFRVGSISKTFLGLAFVKLADHGRVDLRARVGDLAPELEIRNRWPDSPITLAHLFEHTAGFDDMHPNETFAPITAETTPLGEILARNPASRVARWRPGSRFSYANPGYTVAAYVLEKLTGRSYEDVLTRELLEPLGMTGAALRWTPEVDARLARGYHTGDGPLPYFTLYHRPAGNLMASPRELAAIVQLYLARGGVAGVPLISPAGIARTERSETVALDAGDASYGLSTYGDVYERAVVRGHEGGIPGFLSSYGYLPRHDVGFVVLINSTRPSPALRKIRHLVIEHLLAGVHVPPPPRARVPEHELRRWIGNYHFAAPRHQLFAYVDRMQPGVELFIDRGRMLLRFVPAVAPPLELVPLGDDRFRLSFASGSEIKFGRVHEGRRAFTISNTYFVEEPRARSLVFALGPLVCLGMLASAFVLPLRVLRRRVGPAPSLAWQLIAAGSLFALPHLLGEAFARDSFSGPSVYTVAICALTIAFAISSVNCGVQALRWLVLPGSLLGKLHRLAFAAAACCATGYLAAYEIIGIRLWRY